MTREDGAGDGRHRRDRPGHSRRPGRARRPGRHRRPGRDPGRAAAADITAATGNRDVDVFVADMSAQGGPRAGGRGAGGYPRLDVLVNNVGGYWAHRHVTADGLEHTFALNHLAPFLLTNLLLDRLRATAPARVVTVSSGAQSMGRIDFDDLQGERGYAGQRAYNQSKLANVMFTYELARRLEGTGVTANVLHPGVVRTGFGAGGRTPLDAAAAAACAPVHEDPRSRCRDLCLPGVGPELDGVSGVYFANRRPERKSSSAQLRRGRARRLWGRARSWSDSPPHTDARKGPHETRSASGRLRRTRRAGCDGRHAGGGRPGLRRGGHRRLSLMDHYFQLEFLGDATEPMLEGYTTLGFLAAHTSTVELQLLMTGVTYRHPGILAKTVATLDVLSGGRAALGIGAAWYEREHRGLGVPFPPLAERFERLDETLQVVRQMWSDDNGPFHGRHFDLAETVCSPQPLPGRRSWSAAAGRRRRCAWWPSTPTPATSSPAEVPPDAGRPQAVRAAGVVRARGPPYDDIRRTVLWNAPIGPDAAGGAAFVEEMRALADVGVQEVHVMPLPPTSSADPVGFVRALGEHVVPTLRGL